MDSYMFTEVIFDVETQKLFDEIEDRSKMADLGVSVVSAYKRKIDAQGEEKEGEMRSFWTPDMEIEGLGEQGFDELWSWFEGADRIIGFNSLGFDVPILDSLYPRDLFKLSHFDILEKIKEKLGHRLSLDAIAKESLDQSKMAVGIDAVLWWKKGDVESLDKLKKYCEVDVEVTKKVYDKALREGNLRYKNKWNEIKEVDLDFKYPEKEEDSQLGLF